MSLPRRTLLLTLIAATAGLAGCGAPPARAASGSLVEIRLIDRSRGDEPLAEYRHRGSTWVAGDPGHRYAVRLSNRSGGRVLVVLSVDGVNAITGETAATRQTGYVLAPWQSADITGWRKSDAEAAAFYFTALPDSYAARTGRPGNVGVIGAAVFRERPPPPVPVEPWPSVGRGDGALRQESGSGAAAKAATPSARESDLSSMAPQRDERLGTGHGEREYAPVTRTAFERASAQPSELVQLRYDSWANLVTAGVVAPRRGGPRPFPGYVPDPGS